MRRRDFQIGLFLLGTLFVLVIPLGLRMKVRSNEAAFGDDIRLILDLQDRFFDRASHRRYGNLEQVFGPDYAPATLSSSDREQFVRGERGGYKFRLLPRLLKGGQPGFTLEAAPINYRRSGMVSFFVDESKVVRAGDLHGEYGTIELPEAN